MLTLRQWRSLDLDSANRCAEAVAVSVGADDVELGWPDSWYQPVRVARFRLDGQVFALVPGGEARLGYDARRFEPLREELASYLGDYDAHLSDRTREDEDASDPACASVPVLPGQLELFSVPSATPTPGPPAASEPAPPWRPARGDVGDLRAYLTARLTAPRTVTMPTMLVTVESTTAGLTEVTPDHPMIVEHLRSHRPWRPGVLGSQCDQGVPDEDEQTYIRVEFDTSGNVRRAWTAEYTTFDRVIADLAADGRRLLNPDEWEYAHGLGAGTLFPWGDRFHGWTASETVTGLRWGDPYWPELTSVRGEVRGSDFGDASCGGCTEFFHAFLRAPAFREPDIVNDETGIAAVRRRRYRAAFDVPHIAW